MCEFHNIRSELIVLINMNPDPEKCSIHNLEIICEKIYELEKVIEKNENFILCKLGELLH